MTTLAERAAAAVGIAIPDGPHSPRNPPGQSRAPADPAAQAQARFQPVNVVPGFAPRLECARVIAYFEEVIARNPANTGDGFFDGRVLWKTSFPEGSPAARILHRWQLDAEELVSRYYGRRLVSDNAQVVKWPEGKAMEPHRDDRHPDESQPHNTPYREFAGLVYLNDDYREGQIYFPELNAAHKPEAGQLVFFPGRLWHGVMAPVGGARYTSPQWFTGDVARRDPTLGPPG